jgi:hypothetical protein
MVTACLPPPIGSATLTLNLQILLQQSQVGAMMNVSRDYFQLFFVTF